MSFLYPRLISISRPNQSTTIGAQGYGGLTKANETIIASDIPAHIQVDRQGTVPTAKLPGDAAGESIWKIVFKADLGLIQTRDIITDDLEIRYQVIAADWKPLATTCRVQIMQT